MPEPLRPKPRALFELHGIGTTLVGDQPLPAFLAQSDREPPARVEDFQNGMAIGHGFAGGNLQLS